MSNDATACTLCKATGAAVAMCINEHCPIGEPWPRPAAARSDSPPPSFVHAMLQRHQSMVDHAIEKKIPEPLRHQLVADMYSELARHAQMIEWLGKLGETRPSINTIAARHFDWVERMGWHNKGTLASLALLASEVGEAADECRGNDAASAALARISSSIARAVNACRGEAPSPEFGTELADIILRTLDLAVTHKVDIGLAIAEKMALNESRGNRGRVV